MDAGANLSVTSDNISQFAFMGAKYMEKIYGVDRPRIGQLNNGTEYNKGNDLQVESYQLLSESGLNFVGNVESKAVPFDTCDVLVTDGYTGNIFLKSIEGMGKMMMVMLKEILYTNIATRRRASSRDFPPGYQGARLFGRPRDPQCDQAGDLFRPHEDQRRYFQLRGRLR